MKLIPKLFTKNFQVGQFLFETYSAEITIEEGDNQAEAFAKAKQYTIQECLKNNPHLVGNNLPIFSAEQEQQVIVKEPKMSQEDSFLFCINNATSRNPFDKSKNSRHLVRISQQEDV